MAEEQRILVPQGKEINLWWRVLVTTLLAFSTGIMVMVLTGNPILFSTVLTLGSLAVPVAYVAFFLGRRHLSKLILPTIILGFL